MLGAVHGRTAGRSRNDRHWSRQLRKKSGSQRGDSSLSTRSGQRDPGAEPQETAMDVALKALESLRGSQLTEALAVESSGPFQPLLSLPGKYLGCVDPGPCLPHETLGETPKDSPDSCPTEVSFALGLEPTPQAHLEMSPPPLLPGSREQGACADCIWATGKQEHLPTLLPCFSPSPCPDPSTWPISVAAHLENTRQSDIRSGLPLPASRAKLPFPGLTRADMPRVQPPHTGLHSLAPRHSHLKDTRRLYPQCVRQKSPAARRLVHVSCTHTHTSACTHAYSPSFPSGFSGSAHASSQDWK